MSPRSMRLAAACGVVLSVSLLSSSLWAADAAASETADTTGVWTWEADYGGGLVLSTLTIKADGDTLAGTYKNDKDTYPLKDVSVKGDKLICAFFLPIDGEDTKIQLEGTVKGNKVTGIITADVGGNSLEFDWKAKRALKAGQVVGVWKLRVVSDDGQVYTPTVKINLKDGKLGGTYVTTQIGSFSLKHVATTKDTLDFHTTIEFGGNELDLKYSGRPDGNKLKGTLQYEVAGNTGEADFEGELSPAKAGDGE